MSRVLQRGKAMQFKWVNKSPYAELGVEENADMEIVKKAWRKLGKKYHPDLGGDANEFCRLNEAYNAIVSGEYATEKAMYSQLGVSVGGIERVKRACTFNSLFDIGII